MNNNDNRVKYQQYSQGNYRQHKRKDGKLKYRSQSSQSEKKYQRSRQKSKKHKKNMKTQKQQKHGCFLNQTINKHDKHEIVESNQNQSQITNKQLPSFQASGILLQFYNSREGVSLKFFQPPQSRPPNQSWRMYVFKGQLVLKPIILQKSAYLIGKDQRVVDILCQNPSISRQHAVIQFRLIQKNNLLQLSNGLQIKEVIQPYIMDLQSTNGTFLNDQRIESSRYYQLLHKDVLKFGFSQRQYVIVRWQQQKQQDQ